MLKITGLDEVKNSLKSIEKISKLLNGYTISTKYDPNDPSSIEQAINKLHQEIDDKSGRYLTDPITSPIINTFKEKARETLIKEAAIKRLNKT